MGDRILDCSDIDRYLGKPMQPARMRDPVAPNDIRRWAQGMHYPNRLHYDDDFAAESRFGRLVAPQSFAVAMDYGHGCHPAGVGKIPGSHLIFGGEEWWFFGSLIRPGDKLFQQRRFDGYDVKDTSFAGPTVFQRGDTEHRNQHGVLVARERATAIRYLIAEANRRGVFGKERATPKRWDKQELAEIHELRLSWILSNREGRSPRWADVQVGDKLPRRVIGLSPPPV
ncbi:FAS1-like dehydratase domain-containing protein [Sinimarinibacterium thermocellulolyticum]|uniref:MaoC family dehydratase N-terminal domain-containing protein n=1 Tax=Sinimarinibacterium thermocellulolyticum TaxID=3170016 RepID=A0ABV2AE17_9GAMM